MNLLTNGSSASNITIGHQHEKHEEHVPPYAVLFIFLACCIGGKRNSSFVYEQATVIL